MTWERDIVTAQNLTGPVRPIAQSVKMMYHIISTELLFSFVSALYQLRVTLLQCCSLR